ncbi:ogr/Delta-like zinc finger family protein [Cupriavidus nantongensis]|uniref:ogr/Delta-like zinc finger family protein n=1 Tax=Cupriavidus nantongensis TaxID=1796606 RepID=UPI0009ECD1D2
MRLSIKCPHCRARAAFVKSREMSLTMREVTYRCTNEYCGHVYVANLEVCRTLSPSSIPDPQVHIPLSRHVRRDRLHAVLEGAAAAPDNDAAAGRQLAQLDIEFDSPIGGTSETIDQD